MEDEVVIARASSGLALRGIHVGSSEDIRRQADVKQVLRRPEKCELTGPDQVYRMETISFSTIDASTSFCKAVEKSGWSFAVSASAQLACMFGGKISAGMRRGNEKEETKFLDQFSLEACQMHYWYIPKASFHIPRHQMRLSDEALDDMRRVQTLNDAEKFLCNYNSHVSTGQYHIGGVLFKGVTIMANSSTRLETMLKMAATNFNGKVEGYYMGFKAGPKVAILNEHSSASTERKSSHEAMLGTVAVALGPQTADEAEFKAGLEDKSTWYIIDMSEGGVLVPIWEIALFEDSKDLQKSCNLLCEAWQRSVSPEAHKNDRLFELLQSSSTTTPCSLPSCSGLVKKDESIKILKTRLDQISGFDDVTTSTQSPLALKEILSNIWVAASEMNDSKTLGWDARQLLFTLPGFDNLLLTIAQSTESDMEGAKQLVRHIISRDVELLLEKAGVSLKEAVRAFLRNPVQEVLTPRLPPSDHYSPTGLLGRLKDLVASHDRHTADLAMSTASAEGFGICVARAIKSCLRQDMNEKVKTVIRNHGFQDNGECDCDVECVTKDQVNVIIEELESALDEQSVRTQKVLLPCNSASITVTVPPYTMPPKNVYTYNGDMLVDRPMESSEDPHTWMIDCIRHRMEPFASVLRKPSSNSADPFDCFFVEADDSVNEGTTSDDETTNDSTPNSSPFILLVELLMLSDLLAQIALFQLLLEQRFAVPLVVPDKRLRAHGFGHFARALDFVQVKLANKEILSIAEDTKLPRVVFISNRKVASRRETAEMANEVMNCQIPSRHFKGTDTENGPTVVEFGVGFLATPNDQRQEHKPCLVLCVWGDHNQLGEFLGKVADMIIVETDPDGKPRFLAWTREHRNVDVLYWNINSANKSLTIDKGFKRIWGSFKELTEDISKYLERAINLGRFKGRKGQAPTLKECLSGIPPFNKETPISNIANLDAILQCERPRDSLPLQKTFSEEAQIYFESLGQKGNKVELEQRMWRIRGERARAAEEVQKLPILQFFLQLLSEKRHVKRRIGIVHFQMSIDKKLHSTLEKTVKKVEVAFEISQQNPESSELKQKYREAKADHVDHMLGLEHLWRELSHIFVADPRKRELPMLAAHHLLDGFPLEFLDGDASMFHKLWVETVLVELDTVLHASLKHKPKVFVLSVLGLQSSGKSTLLNLMFGTQLKTSAGQCTRGVYLQLVKSEWPEFDYLLLLDTEGIRAPEYFGLKDAELKDNRLATFAVLPADACIIMVANEEDNGLKEVLPMVMLAFKGSAMAEKYAGRMQAQLFFVYRSVDTNDVEKLRKNQRKLQEDLRDASLAVAKLGFAGTVEESSQASISPFCKFQVHVDEERSDVKYLGNLKKGNVPPVDNPDWDYGRKVVELRKYIHQRVLDGRHNWEGHRIVEWTDYLGMVWQCITDANFELRFLNRIEYEYYHLLHAKLGSHQQNVGRKYLEEFERLEGKLQVDKATEHSLSGLWNIFKSRVEKIVWKEGKAVDGILEQNQWQRWKVAETARWNDFCFDLDQQWEARLKDCIDGVLKFDNVVKEYSNKIQMEIESGTETYQFNIASPDREERMMSNFTEVFERILLEASEKHPQLAKRVPGYVHVLYVKSPVVGEKFSFTKHKRATSGLSEKLENDVGSKLKTLRGHDKKKLRMEEKLISKVERNLQDAKQYADHLVVEMIGCTEELVAEESNNDQQTMHNFVKDVLTQKLQAIQQKWDMHHNVAKRLEAERARLWLFFKNCADGVGGTKTLSVEVGNLLSNKLVESFKHQLSSSVSHKLQAEAWVCNWKVMRAHLDLHLVDLIETKQTDKLLDCVTDGTLHYKRLVDLLLEEEINRQLQEDNSLWTWFVKSIQEAVKLAAISAEGSNSASKSSIFLENLKHQLLSKTKSSELARSISFVNEEIYSKYGDVIDFQKVGEDVCTMVGSVELDLTSNSIQAEVRSLVKERVIACASENARPRCDEHCPCCFVTCVLPARHAGRHDTLHQPQGLCGIRKIPSDELAPESCSKSLILNAYMVVLKAGIETLVPYKDFEKYYPTWTAPYSEGFGVPAVREYIFAHYQEDLVQRHSASYPELAALKICTNIPSEYLLHDLKGLRCELENRIHRYRCL